MREREGKCNSTVSGLNNKKNDIVFTEIVKKGERTDFKGKDKWPNCKRIPFKMPVRQTVK